MQTTLKVIGATSNSFCRTDCPRRVFPQTFPSFPPLVLHFGSKLCRSHLFILIESEARFTGRVSIDSLADLHATHTRKRSPPDYRHVRKRSPDQKKQTDAEASTDSDTAGGVAPMETSSSDVDVRVPDSADTSGSAKRTKTAVRGRRMGGEDNEQRRRYLTPEQRQFVLNFLQTNPYPKQEETERMIGTLNCFPNGKKFRYVYFVPLLQ